MSATLRQTVKSPWRFMPASIGAWLGGVALVNFTMVYFALHTFPGQAGGNNAFDISNHYDAVLQTAQHETSLGWTAIAKAVDRKPAIWVTQLDTSPLTGATLQGVATRPVGPEARTPLSFTAGQDGKFTAAQTLAPGRWDLTLTIVQGARTLHATRRIVVQ